MHDAFNASAHFLGTWAAGTGALLTALALGVPTYRGLRWLLRIVSHALHHLALHTLRRARPANPVAPPSAPGNAAPAQLHDLVHSARGLWTQISHERASRARWFDGELPRWLAFCVGDDSRSFSAATEIRRQVWGWLQQALEAETQLAADAAELVADTERQLRNLVLGEGDLPERVDAMLAVLVGFDVGARQLDSRGYRASAVPGPRMPEVVEAPGETSQEDASRADAHADSLRAFEADICRVARRYTNDTAARDDLAQEIRLALWVALPKHRGDASVRTYVLRIAHYCGAKFARRSPRWAQPQEIVDLSVDLFQSLERVEQRARLHQAITGLPDHERTAVELLLTGMSYREIAGRLNITEGSASVRVSRARKRLRLELAPLMAHA